MYTLTLVKHPTNLLLESFLFNVKNMLGCTYIVYGRVSQVVHLQQLLRREVMFLYRLRQTTWAITS